MKYFSNAVGAFFAGELRKHYEVNGRWPDDAVEVTEAQEKEIRDMQSAGCIALLIEGGVKDGGAQPGYISEKLPPKVCTPAQGLVALFALKGITEDDVLAAIDRIPESVQRYTARIGYQRATSWERNSPTMQVMALLLQLSETDLDDLFDHAVTVQV